MANSEASKASVSSQAQLIQQVADIIFNRKFPATSDALPLTAKTLGWANLFARAAGLDLEFRSIPDSEDGKTTFRELFLVLAREAEQAVYAYS